MPSEFVFQSPELVNTPIFAGQSWSPSFFIYDQHAIKSTTPIGSITQIVTYDPHGITNNTTARVVMTDKSLSLLDGAYVATVVDPYTFTVPVQSYSNGGAKCGKCGTVTPLTGAAYYFGFYTLAGMFVVSPTITAVNLANGELLLSLSEANTKALDVYDVLAYQFWVRTSGSQFFCVAQGNVPIVANIVQTLP